MPRYRTSEPVTQMFFKTLPPADLAYIQGRLWWDDNDSTLRVDIGNTTERVTMQIGQEQYLYVRNNTGVDIANAQAVTCVGSLAYRPTVQLAQADDILTSCIRAMTTQAIAKNTDGFASTFGLVRGIDTQTPNWNEGDTLYLSETVAGGIKNTVPTSGYTIIVGRVLRRHPNDGIVLFAPRPIPAFGDIVGGNYTEFEYDGTMQAVGNATTWRDELGALLGSRLESPGSDIVQNLTEGTITFKASARYPTDFITYSLQINHDWLVQSVVEFHIHWWQTNAQKANWLVGYRWQVNGQAKTAGWTLLPLTNLIFAYSAGTLNQISDGSASITPPATATLSDIFQVKLWRDYTNVSTLFAGAETTGLDIEAMSADMHRRSDTMGSRTEYTK